MTRMAVLCLTIPAMGCGGAGSRSPAGPAVPAADRATGAEATGSGRSAAPPEGAATRGSPSPGHPVSLPVQYVAGRFVLAPRTPSGTTVTLIADTGGGLYLSRQAAERLHLAVTKITGDGGQQMDAAALPAFDPAASIPPLTVFDGRLPILPPEQTGAMDPVDGLVGQAWFKDRTWTFDYPGKRLLWRAPGDLPAHDAGHQVALGFPHSAAGKRETNYPRIQVVIDGQTIDLLFDTGATVRLTDAARAALGDGGPARRATSFISTSTFERWRKRHPDWKVVEHADANAGGEPMIEVPAVTVAGFTVGPVWFTRRADKNFHQWMSQWMDKQIDGALGGSALHSFRVTVDYPGAVAVFERPDSPAM